MVISKQPHMLLEQSLEDSLIAKVGVELCLFEA